MLKIALVDDEQDFIELEKQYIESELAKQICEYTIDTFTEGKAFMVACEQTEYSIVFLDIDIFDVSGFDIAKIIRSLGNKTDIIFVSNHEHFVFNAFDFQPFQFIRKQFLKDELGKAITSLIIKYKNENRYMNIISMGEQRKVFLNDIIYIESNKHILIVHTTSDNIEIRGKISDKETELSNYNFVRVHSGYLVNLKYVVSIGKDSMRLEDGTTISVSRQRIKDTKSAFQLYLRDKV